MKPHVLPMLDYFNIEQRNKAQISTNDTVTLSIMVNMNLVTKAIRVKLSVCTVGTGRATCEMRLKT